MYRVGNEIEFHRRGSNSRMDERTRNEIYLAPFRAGIRAGALAVMTAYNQLNGEWCGQSQYVNTILLREQLGFQWIGMTDWIGTYDGVKLAPSGTDLEMPGGWALKKDRAKVIGTPDHRPHGHQRPQDLHLRRLLRTELHQTLV